MAALILWWLLLEVLSLVALPLTLALLRHLPDRGYPLARVLGIFLPSVLAWFLGTWQLASYGTGLLILCLLVIAGLSGVLLWKDRTILPFLRENWRLVLTYEVLFAAALFLGAVLRIYSGYGIDIFHTEQPMDFALTNAILQSRSLPPQDPWLAGYSINYYYLGYFQAASLTLLSGLPSELTFNLNLATLFALAATACFSLGYNLTLAMDATARRRAAVVGSVALLFVLVVGNQAGALQVLTGSSQAVALDAGEMWTVLRARLAGEGGSVPLGHTVTIAGNDFGGGFNAVSATTGRQVDDFDWWWPSRVLWDERPSLEAIEQLSLAGLVERALLGWQRYVPTEEVTRSYTITEFPFFSFYLGDMHPHVMALPLTLLAASLALNVLLAPERGRAGFRLDSEQAGGRSYWSWFFFVLNALVLGGLYMANSWDFPTYFLLYGAAWVWRWRRDAGERWTRQDTLAIARDLGLLVLLCIVLYLPFYLTFRSLVGSNPIPLEILDTPVLGRIVTLPILSKVFQTLFFVLWDKSSLYTLGVIFGLFLYPAVTWLLSKGIKERATKSLWGWGLLAISLLAAWLFRFPYLVLVPAVVLGWKLLGKSRPAEAMALLMLMLALLLLLGCDIIYIRDIYESRMNTIFKFYYQAWALLAIVGTWAIGETWRAYLRAIPARVLWGIPLLLLLAGGLVYPAMSMRLALRQKHDWTLDGLSMMQRNYPGDYAGVRWLRENAAPDAVVLESVGGDWDWTHGRVSMATGRPTLLGWDGHEAQWRGGHPEAYAQIGIRREEANRIYTTTNPLEARQLLEKHGVDYVFVGFAETALTKEGLAKFAQLGVLVFEAPGVQIYQIVQ